MLPINVVVVDFIQLNHSAFIGDINNYFWELPKQVGRNYLRKTQLESALEEWEKYAKISLDDSLDLILYPVPLLEEHKKDEQFPTWEILIEGALGYIFVIANESDSWSEANKVIAKYRAYADLPFVIVVKGQDIKYVDISYLRTALNIGANAPVFGYHHVLRIILEEIIKGLLDLIIDDISNNPAK